MKHLVLFVKLAPSDMPDQLSRFIAVPKPKHPDDITQLAHNIREAVGEDVHVLDVHTICTVEDP